MTSASKVFSFYKNRATTTATMFVGRAVKTADTDAMMKQQQQQQQ